VVISNRNSFRVLFDEILACILFERYIYILALEMASQANRHPKLLWFEVSKMLTAVLKRKFLVSFIIIFDSCGIAWLVREMASALVYRQRRTTGCGRTKYTVGYIHCIAQDIELSE